MAVLIQKGGEDLFFFLINTLKAIFAINFLKVMCEEIFFIFRLFRDIIDRLAIQGGTISRPGRCWHIPASSDG